MQTRVVLVRPRYAGNIGATLRIACNFAVAELVLVAPACEPDDPEYLRMAMGSDLLVPVRETADLAAAVGDAELVIATTSLRHRDSRMVLGVPTLRTLVAQRDPAVLALVFGPERGGLSREELRLSHARLTVPTNPAYPVLNLAQAVAIVLAGLSEGSFASVPPADAMDQAAPLAELDGAICHLQNVMLESGFLDQANPTRVTDQLRRWLGRTVPTRREIAILHALAAHVKYLIERP